MLLGTKGEWRNEFLVKGEVTYRDGSRYEGCFSGSQHFVREGQGILTLSNGQTYECVWQNGNPVNKVKITYPKNDLTGVYNVYVGPVVYLVAADGTQQIVPHGTGTVSIYDKDRKPLSDREVTFEIGKQVKRDLPAMQGRKSEPPTNKKPSTETPKEKKPEQLLQKA